MPFVAAKPDTCKIGTRAALGGTTPEPTAAWTYGSAIRCVYEQTGSTEVLDEGQAALTDVVFRVPLGTTVARDDRIQLTKRDGVALGTAITCEVVGDPVTSFGEIVVRGRKVVGSSAN